MDKLNLASLRDKISSKLSSANVSAKSTKAKKSGSKKDKKQEKKPPVDDELRQEAMALGATEDDLALIGDMDDADASEQEFGTDGNVDSNFSADLNSYMKEIGLDAPALVADAESDEAPDSDSELEEESKHKEKSKEESKEETKREESKEKSKNEEPKEKPKKDKKEEPKEKSKKDKESKKDKKEKPKEEPERIAEKPKKSDKITDLSSVLSANLAIPNRPDWYNTPVEPVRESENLDRFGRERALDRAKATIEKDAQTYLAEFASRDSQRKFLAQILSDGTLNDKVSALTLLVQESPMHNMKAMDTLVSYCGKKSRNAALQSINALKDLLLNGLLPDRKLVSFAKQPLRRDASDVQLAVWYYEDYLKSQYFQFITILEHLSHDPIVHVRMNVISHIFDLLKAKPEQEANLLRLGVNKLGDTDNKVSAKTSYQILQLEQAHPAMKKIITDAVIDLMLRPNVEYHAIYYSILTLNQTILTRKEIDLANSLVKTYFTLFEKILKLSDEFNGEKKEDKFIGKSEQGRKNPRKNFKKGKKGGKSVKPNEKTEAEVVEEKNTRLFSALLTGLNRAFPFSELPSSVYELHLDTLFKITHSTNFNTSVQALMLIHHIITSQKLDLGRFYRTLYESLLDPRLALSSKQGIYLNLLFKALKDDIDKPRVMAFAKRMLQISAHWINVGAIAGMIFLLSQLSKTLPEIRDLTIDPASRPDPENDVNELKEEYDGKKRDPKYANAQNSSLWEIGNFVSHYHPTVAVYASSLLSGEEQPKPDLGLYTLAHFLDRFVYKNAKEKTTSRGSSIMQPLGGAQTGSLLVKASNLSGGTLPANTENWLSKKVEDIRPDEKFFFEYFTSKQNKLKEKAETKKADFDEEDENDDEIWQALVNSRPEVEDGSDDGLSFDEADFLDYDDGSSEEALEEANEEDEEIDEEGIEEIEEEEEDEEEDGDDEAEGAKGSDSDGPDMFGLNSEDELSDDEPAPEPSKKRSREASGEKKTKKTKLSSLPVFASVDDYSQYLDSEDDE